MTTNTLKLTAKFVFTSPNERQFKRVLNRKVASFIKTHLEEHPELSTFKGNTEVQIDWKRTTVPLTKEDLETQPDSNRYSVKVTITVTLI